jgi:hypothetical protein
MERMYADLFTASIREDPLNPLIRVLLTANIKLVSHQTLQARPQSADAAAPGAASTMSESAVNSNRCCCGPDNFSFSWP